MFRIAPNDALAAALTTAAGTGAALVAGAPLLALAGSGAAVLFVGARSFRASRGGRAAASHPAPGLPGPVAPPEFMSVAIRDVARAERYGEPLTLCIARVTTATPTESDASEGLHEHLRRAFERVTRASDTWCDIGGGMFAALLERCSAADAAAFTDRLSLAATSRPLTVDGVRVAVNLAVSATCYDAHQFVGAEDFLAAGFNARLSEPGKRQRLVADGRFLRESVYGSGCHADAA